MWHGRYVGEEQCIQDFVGKHQGKEKLRRPTRKWEDNIKMDLKRTRCASMDWIVLLTFLHYFVVYTATALGAGQFVVPNDKL
jgi:hypothetical protein